VSAGADGRVDEEAAALGREPLNDLQRQGRPMEPLVRI